MRTTGSTGVPVATGLRCQVSGLRSQVSGLRSRVSGVRDGRRKTGDGAFHGRGIAHDRMGTHGVSWPVSIADSGVSGLFVVHIGTHRVPYLFRLQNDCIANRVRSQYTETEIETGNGTGKPPDPQVCQWPLVSGVGCQVSGPRCRVSGMQVSGIRDGRRKTGDRASNGTGTSHGRMGTQVSHFPCRSLKRSSAVARSPAFH